MAAPLTVALPPNLHLWPGCVVRVTALDAATGDEVPNVLASSVSFEVDASESDFDALAVGPFMLVTGPQG